MIQQHGAAAMPGPSRATSAGGGAGDGLPTPRRYWALAAIWLGMAMSVLDGVIANIALPTIARELGVSATAAIWVINGYQIAIVMLLLPFASLGEILGYRRVFAAGLALFVAASVGCSLADSLPQLVACRFVQGIGAAAIMAVNGALVRLTYPSRRLGRGIGYNATIVALSAAAGPTLAASILAATSWRWLFAVNVPIGLASLVIGLAALPVGQRARRSFDWRSALLNAAAFAALFVAVNDMTAGRFLIRTAIALVIAPAAAAVLIRIARAAADPLIPLDLMRIPVLRRSYVVSMCGFAAQMIGLIALPFYLEGRFGYGHVATGLLITGLPVGIAIAAPLSGRLAERSSGNRLGVVGLLLLAGGFGLVTLVHSGAAAWLVACLALAGIGFGLFQAPNNRVMLGEAPPRRGGAAAGMMAVARQFGQTLGAVLAALVFRLAGTVSIVPFVIAAGFGVAAALILAAGAQAASSNQGE